MLGLVETFVGKELGGLGGLREGLEHVELLRTAKLNILYATLVFKSNTTDLTNESIQHYL